MSPVQNVLRQLVQRRLWPVAILLIAALVAVPVMLAKNPEPAVAPPAPAADSTDDELATQPIVSLVEAGASAKRRQVLGEEKNPFRVDPPKEDKPAAEQAKSDSAPTEEKSSGAGAGGGTEAVTPVADVPSTTTPTEPEVKRPKKQYDRHELTIRFGAGEDAKRQSVKKLEPLPSAELPALIYVGVLKDGKVAEFLVDSGVTADGDGECHPSPDACETIRLREGEIEFLDVKDETGAVVAQYQLELLEIHKGSGAKASKASKASKTSKAKAAKASRSELRSVTGHISAFIP
jgi:hypothetical protein